MAPSKGPLNSDLCTSPACPALPDLAPSAHFGAIEMKAQRDEVRPILSTSTGGEPRARGRARDLWGKWARVGLRQNHNPTRVKRSCGKGRPAGGGGLCTSRSEEATPGLIPAAEGFKHKWEGVLHRAAGRAREGSEGKGPQKGSPGWFCLRAQHSDLPAPPLSHPHPSPLPSSAWRSLSSGAKCTPGWPPAHIGSHPGCEDRQDRVISVGSLPWAPINTLQGAGHWVLVAAP